MGTGDLVEDALHHHIALLESVPLLPMDRQDHLLLYASNAWKLEEAPALEVHYALHDDALRLEYVESFAIGEYVPVSSYAAQDLCGILRRRNGPLWETLEREVSLPLIRRPSRGWETLQPNLLPEIVTMGLDRYWAMKLVDWRSVVPGELERSRSRAGRIVSMADWKKQHW